MTRDEFKTLNGYINGVAIQPDTPMNLEQMKIYIKGFEDAQNAVREIVDKCYRMMKTD